MQDKRPGYLYVLLAVILFAGQDGFSRLLAERYPAVIVAMVRFWAFAAFVTVLAASSPGGLRGALFTPRPILQLLRGVLLSSNIVVIVYAYTIAGLALSQAIFQATPLIVTILSVPLLGEEVGWRRGVAVAVGLAGVLVLLNPQNAHVDIRLLLPLAASLLYALYGIATRAVGQHDSAVTSVLYAGVGGALALTFVGPFYWTPVHMADWPAMTALSVCGALSHFFLIRAYGLLNAVEVQPLTYLQLVLSVVVATVFFGETVTWNMIAGAAIVVGAGLFTVWREYRLGVRQA
ncbi:drug/metabolite transporter (DMT)-like permease [Sinorhizobium terangae]|uniref:EamA family transporter n=1 Tax=Sinorhizobium terangae TaxID=110322 RepID=A0A6N7LMK9_SINTE|nr:DMT family transporter [Sinorhizobium terangae]MBB4188740.1 drug/metabolite transporter (DMT)-like permease [Sinorhizobium terangae]MQX18886.1 EamA family transporter [Sinorhizobium terangae]